MYSNKNLNNPIRLAYFEGRTKVDQKYNEAALLKKEILKLHNADPDGSIMVLGRINSNIDDLFEYNDLGYIEELGTKVSFVGMPDFQFDAMTIHKSKGLTADYVFIIGLNKSFPQALSSR